MEKKICKSFNIHIFLPKTGKKAICQPITAKIGCNRPRDDNRKLFQFYASKNIFPVEYPPE